MTEISDNTGFLDRWLSFQQTTIGRHALLICIENDCPVDDVIQELGDIVRSHYVAPEITARRLEELGAAKTAQLLRERLPTTKRARSGDLGEILATEVAERKFAYRVPIRRLRWKDGREMALRGDDIIAIARDASERLAFLKGEAKSRSSLTQAVVSEAAETLDRDHGRPTRHSVLFVADRLREQGEDTVARELEEAVLSSFSGAVVEHLLFVLCGNNPEALLSGHVRACANRYRRHAVGVRIRAHSQFIERMYSEL